MGLRKPFTRRSLAAIASALALSLMPTASLAHMGDSGHLHVPGDATTPTSSVWCVSFSQDPGTWRPEGETAVDASSIGSVSIIFKDCADILDGYYAIESYDQGFERTVVGERAVSLAEPSDPATVEEISKRFQVPFNYMFMGHPSGHFPYRLEEFRGVRLIV